MASGHNWQYSAGRLDCSEDFTERWDPRQYAEGAVMEEEKQRAVELAVAQVERAYGKGAIMKAGDGAGV